MVKRTWRLGLVTLLIAVMPAFLPPSAVWADIPQTKGVPGVRNPQTASATAMYVFGDQFVTADGASVTMSQESPRFTSGDSHSLAELAVQSRDQEQIVEIGWIVSSWNGGTRPHLFVYHWVNGQTSCFNACGFVPVQGPVQAGDELPVGRTGTFAIDHHDGAWWMSYNGSDMGYFPDSLWGGAFTKAGLIQAFGEIRASSPSTCTDMGNGTYGSRPGSAQIGGYTLSGTTTQPRFGLHNTHANLYDYGAQTATSFTYGGPGAC